MEKFKRIYDFVKEYLWILTGAWVVLGVLVKNFHTYYMMPVVIEPQVRLMATKLYNDSSDVWRARVPKGFGGTLAGAMGVENKIVAADSIAALYHKEIGKEMKLDYLVRSMNYQQNFNTTVFLMATQPFNYNGVRFRKHIPNPENFGNFDVYWHNKRNGHWLKAVYYADEDSYYSFDFDGNRIKCD